MVMDSGMQELSEMINTLRYDDIHTDQNIFSAIGLGESQPFLGYKPSSCTDFPQCLSGKKLSNNLTSTVSAASTSAQGDSPEDSEIFSDIVLSYISRMLMEENIDEKVSTYQQEAAIRATEKPFYDILAQQYPHHSLESPDGSSIRSGQYTSITNGSNSRSPQHASLTSGRSSSSSHNSNNFSNNGGMLDNESASSSNWQSQLHSGSIDYSSHSSYVSSTSVNNTARSFEQTLNSIIKAPNIFFGHMPAWHFEKGAEEARKFLPRIDNLVIDLEADSSLKPEMLKMDGELFNIKVESEEKESPTNGSRGRKNPNTDELDLIEGRISKHSAVSFGLEDVKQEMLDMLVLCQGDKCSNKIYELREAMQQELSKNSQNGHTKSSTGGKIRGKKQTKKDVVDLRSLLINCAQAVATDDRRTANELLKQIRQHASMNGDGSQRLAHWFADGLEARLAGMGSQIYKMLVAKRTTATDILKAYHLYLAACPFKKISHFFSNQTILNVTRKASKVHIVDFGIYFGFQWPCFIKRLSSRDGGPPNLRITGIDVPQPGFRPSERIEETGRRLAEYAKSFNVPFEYQAISSKWETIQVEDLNIQDDEVVVVNCLYRFRNLVDETVVVDSPRNRVLNTIRKMNPHVFVHGIINGSYSAPFFVTRFREALFHYSSLFDMLETNVPKENKQRLLIERDLFAREALNVIACEGSERVERPETYKQWQVRNLRARFSQLPLDPDIMKKTKDKVRASYHKDFVVDEDNRWLLQGWKGRIIYAISSWVPDRT